MQSVFKRISENPTFNKFILGVILAAGILVGIQTYHAAAAPYHDILEVLDIIILLIFSAEVLIKILADADNPLLFFKDPWNTFDLIIVAICWAAHFVPSLNADFVAVIRLARVLRVLRLVHALPQLKMLVDAMLKSIPSMGYVGILLLLLFYIYGAMGVFVFGGNDPLHFGNLHTAMLSLFRISTLEGWSEIMYINIYGCDNPKWGYGPESGCNMPQKHGLAAVIYFVSFVLVGTMIVLNLFIGVIMNAMDEVRAEQALHERLNRSEQGIKHIDDEVAEVHDQLEIVKNQLDLILYRIKNDNTIIPK
ncbi:MAG: ion transporter [Saprospiraceae bacterium]|nr:ion transporter [Saprospiraceae bacterium]